MNIQIFGRNKCFDTKKAERYFKERRIKYQLIDLPRIGMSRRELESVRAAVGLADRFERLLEYPDNIRTPVVRNGRQATVGYRPEVWKNWE